MKNAMAKKRISKFREKDSVTSVHSSAKDLSPIKLMKPETDKGKSVLKALQLRKTVRENSDKKISLQVLSNLLWAACGVNRKKGPFGIPGRTAATASNSQEIDLYVALKEGTYHYDPFKHYLIPVVAGDLRAMAIGRGQVNLGNIAPVRLIYVADIDRLIHTPGYQEPGLLNTEIQKSYYYVDTGLIAGNVYLFAASTGLVAWFHNCDKSGLEEKLNLRVDQRVLFGQTVGYKRKA